MSAFLDLIECFEKILSACGENQAHQFGRSRNKTKIYCHKLTLNLPG